MYELVLTVIAIMEIQVKITMQCYFIYTRMNKTKKTNNNKRWLERGATLYENVNCYKHIGNNHILDNN